MTRRRSAHESEELRGFLPWAQRAAARVSRDPLVIDAAANFALAQYYDTKRSVSSDDRSRRRWIEVVAANHARRLGGKLHRDVAFGKAGSLIPPTGDAQADAHIGRLITEMHTGGGDSLSSLVANRMDFERRWALLSDDHRGLLEAKYVDDRSAKDIAIQRGVTSKTVDNQLLRARRALRLVLEDLVTD